MLRSLSFVSRNREAALAAAALPHLYNLAGHHRMLDLAGGNGTWSIAAASSQPFLRATVVAEPDALASTRKRINAAGLGARVDIVTLDPGDDLPLTGHDLLLLKQIRTHSRASLADYGTRLLLTSPRTDPPLTDTELRAWLRRNDWHLLRTCRLSNTQNLIIADAINIFPEPT